LPCWDDSVPDIDDSWKEDKNKVIEFVKNKGRLPDNKINEDDCDEKNLASWCDR